jgi:hypothetical protein
MDEYGSPSDLASSGGFYGRMAAFQRLEPQESGEPQPGLQGEGSSLEARNV